MRYYNYYLSQRVVKRIDSQCKALSVWYIINISELLLSHILMKDLISVFVTKFADLAIHTRN